MQETQSNSVFPIAHFNHSEESPRGDIRNTRRPAQREREITGSTRSEGRSTINRVKIHGSTRYQVWQYCILCVSYQVPVQQYVPQQGVIGYRRFKRRTRHKLLLRAPPHKFWLRRSPLNITVGLKYGSVSSNQIRWSHWSSGVVNSTNQIARHQTKSHVARHGAMIRQSSHGIREYRKGYLAKSLVMRQNLP